MANRPPGASPCRKRWYNLFSCYLLGLPRFEMVLLRFQFYVLYFHSQLKEKEPTLGQLSKPVRPSQSFDFFFLRFFFFLKVLKSDTSSSIPDTFSLTKTMSCDRLNVRESVHPPRAMRTAKSAVIILSCILVTILFA